MVVFGVLFFLLVCDCFWLLVGVFSGFLMVVFVVVMGFYVLSWEFECGGWFMLVMVLGVWCLCDGCFIVFGILFVFVGIGWVMCLVVLVIGFVLEFVLSLCDFFVQVVFSDYFLLFEFWLVFGVVFVVLVFVFSVVVILVLFDQFEQCFGVLGVVLMSWCVVLEYLVFIVLWVVLLMVLMLVGMVSVFVGLVVIVFWFGYVSWYVYCDFVVWWQD